MKKTVFITGTDTGIGKTLISAGLLLAAREAGMQTVGIKPVASGCIKTSEGWVNEDALMLQRYSSVTLRYDEVNPYKFIPPIAPHIAAEQEGRTLSVNDLLTAVDTTLQNPFNFAVVEGVGGWRVPLNRNETLADFAKALACPVILVVGVRLGCLNHALLTVEALLKDNSNVAGWVANNVDGTDPVTQENIATLKHHIPFPLLGEIPFLNNAKPEDVAEALSIQHLLASD